MVYIWAVVDRVIQQAIAQELSSIYEEQFSESSFGFRPKRGAHDALRQCQKGYWRMAQVLNSVIINKIIAKLGYISMLDYYLIVCEN